MKEKHLFLLCVVNERMTKIVAQRFSCLDAYDIGPITESKFDPSPQYLLDRGFTWPLRKETLWGAGGWIQGECRRKVNKLCIHGGSHPLELIACVEWGIVKNKDVLMRGEWVREQSHWVVPQRRACHSGVNWCMGNVVHRIVWDSGGTNCREERPLALALTHCAAIYKHTGVMPRMNAHLFLDYSQQIRSMNRQWKSICACVVGRPTLSMYCWGQVLYSLCVSMFITRRSMTL